MTSLIGAIQGSMRELEISGTALSLGYIGDRAAVPPLCDLVRGPGTSTQDRSSAVQALGFLADRSLLQGGAPSLYRLKSHCNYAAQFPALNGFMQFFQGGGRLNTDP